MTCLHSSQIVFLLMMQRLGINSHNCTWFWSAGWLPWEGRCPNANSGGGREGMSRDPYPGPWIGVRSIGDTLWTLFCVGPLG